MISPSLLLSIIYKSNVSLINPHTTLTHNILFLLSSINYNALSNQTILFATTFFPCFPQTSFLYNRVNPTTKSGCYNCLSLSIHTSSHLRSRGYLLRIAKCLPLKHHIQHLTLTSPYLGTRPLTRNLSIAKLTAWE